MKTLFCWYIFPKWRRMFQVHSKVNIWFEANDNRLVFSDTICCRIPTFLLFILYQFPMVCLFAYCNIGTFAIYKTHGKIVSRPKLLKIVSLKMYPYIFLCVWLSDINFSNLLNFLELHAILYTLDAIFINKL